MSHGINDAMGWQKKTGMRHTNSLKALVGLTVALPTGGRTAEPVNTQGQLSIQSESGVFVGDLPPTTPGFNGTTSGSGLESEGALRAAPRARLSSPSRSSLRLRRSHPDRVCYRQAHVSEPFGSR